MIVHLLDGTYELYRQFYGRRRSGRPDTSLGAVAGVLHSVLEMIEGGATHLGVATDHVIESFRNDLYAGYKTGEGIEPALFEQFEPLETSLAAMGVMVWPMVELEADDALASAAAVAERDAAVEKVCIWSPDKDLAQCVRSERVVQVDRRSKSVRTETGVTEKFGVPPALIPDFLALVGDAADGYPGIAGIGKVGAARLLNLHGPIEQFPPDVLDERRDEALCTNAWPPWSAMRRSSAMWRNSGGGARAPSSRQPPPGSGTSAWRRGANRLRVVSPGFGRDVNGPIPSRTPG